MARGLEETAFNDLAAPRPAGEAVQRPRRHRRVPAHRPHRGPVDDVHLADVHLRHQPGLRRGGPGHGGARGRSGLRPARRFSTDNGADWFAGSDPSGVTGGGTVAAAADGSGFVWSPEGTGVQHTTGFGSAWSSSTGIPAGAVVEFDRVDPKTFYGFKSGTFCVSSDGGASLTASSATGLPSGDSARFRALPGTEGDEWLAGGSSDGAHGLWHSTDGGASFTRPANVEEADTVGFGKAAAGASYQTRYTSAEIGGVRGIFRSTDEGATWTRINDDAHQWGWTGTAITGDPRVFGRVYVSTNGRGIVHGDSSHTDGGGTGTGDDGGTGPGPSGTCAVT